MSDQLPEIYLARHGETAWSLTGQHTGLTDLPLLPAGEEGAQRLGQRLEGISFRQVFTSSLQRARQTCALAGFGDVAAVDPEMVEWNYGNFDGLTSIEIRQQYPNWNLFVDGCPGGESVSAVSARADRVVERLRRLKGRSLIFSHGHFLRVLALRWCGQDLSMAPHLLLNTATVSVLGYDRHLDNPVLRLWNSGSEMT